MQVAGASASHYGIERSCLITQMRHIILFRLYHPVHEGLDELTEIEDGYFGEQAQSCEHKGIYGHFNLIYSLQ